MAWIRTVPPDKATGSLRDCYERAFRRAGRVWNMRPWSRAGTEPRNPAPVD
jgi:hypothetical protein